MTRQSLPHRRPSVTRDIIWQRGDGGHVLTVTIGFDPATAAAREVFAGGRAGSDLAAVIAESCVLVSLALQRGARAEDLSHSLLRVPSLTGGPDTHASPIGAIVAAVQEAQMLEAQDDDARD